MAGKTSGLGAALWVGGFDVSGDIGSISKIASPIAQLDVTGIDKYAHERLNGVRDGQLEYQAWFNPGTLGTHALFSALPTADVIEMCSPTPPVLGAPIANLVAKQINYDPSRAADGALSYAIQTTANAYGLEWGQLATAGKRTDTTATVGAAIDDGGATAFGLQAYLQVFAFTGTSCTVSITHCATSGGVYTNLVSFTAATAVGAQRVSVANNTSVLQFIKIATTGTFNPCTFAVSYVRNTVAGTSF